MFGIWSFNGGMAQECLATGELPFRYSKSIHGKLGEVSVLECVHELMSRGEEDFMKFEIHYFSVIIL